MNNNVQQKNNIKNDVLEKIKNGEVKMKPKLYHILKIILLAIVAIITLITSALLVSFIVFSLNVSGHLFLLGFGGRGLLTFLILFPWQILLIDIVFIVILEYLLKQFRFGYRNPIMYSLIGMLVIVLALGFFIASTPFHRLLLRRAERSQLPFVGGMYAHLRPPHENNLFRGIVTAIQDSSFNLHSENEIYSVHVPQEIHIKQLLNIDDEVLVAGDLHDNNITAFGIRKLSSAHEPDQD